MRGYYGIGIVGGKTEVNIGTLWRSAHVFGAAFIFTVGRRYRQQSSDTKKTWRSVPLYHYDTISELKQHLPMECRLIGVEMTDSALELHRACHIERACYLLGAEDNGLSAEALAACSLIVKIPGNDSLNVATAGSIVMYDRWVSQVERGERIRLPRWPAKVYRHGDMKSLSLEGNGNIELCPTPYKD